MTIRGIDIASHQGPNFPFVQARQQGFEFAIIKGAGGHNYQNEYRAQQVAGARAAGMLCGFYHYMFEPTSGGGDVDREARNFIAAVRAYWRAGDSLWLDVEEFAKAVGYTGNLGDWIVRWCDLIEAAFGIVPGIYCATWYLQPTGLTNDARLAKYPFWMASWQDALPPKSAMRPWDRVTLWQYNATYTGVTGAHLDCNEFQGTREELIALGTPQAPISQAEVIGGSLGKPEVLVDRGEAAATASVYPFVNERGEACVLVNFGGISTAVLGVNLVDVGISTRNADDEIHDRSIKANVFEDWQKRSA